ncbi:Hypothetical protein NTJ_00978 [Nesidiocoris tenuis]|uniref:Uncharacterized protein n=1 Tax=Nesidiocoris tenuis TaxID=355587 RepID=A0ABN7AAB8_9HEMI|nr:Hypothetical protein NTJ_00978 [Nesidiocoris tenuis]
MTLRLLRTFPDLIATGAIEEAMIRSRVERVTRGKDVRRRSADVPPPPCERDRVIWAVENAGKKLADLLILTEAVTESDWLLSRK